MFKSQMKCQKILCLVCLILTAVLFVYAIGFVTSIYDQYFFTLDKDLGMDYTRVEGTLFFWELQSNVSYDRVPVLDEYGNETGEFETVKTKTTGFVDQVVAVAIADICIALTLFISNTHKRRKYYISNYVTTCAFAGYNVSIAVWIMARLAYFKSQLALVNLDQLKAECELWNVAYRPEASVTSLNIGFAVCVLLIIAAIAIVLNLIWKISLEKRENSMLNQSSVQEEAING